MLRTEWTRQAGDERDKTRSPVGAARDGDPGTAPPPGTNITPRAPLRPSGPADGLPAAGT